MVQAKQDRSKAKKPGTVDAPKDPNEIEVVRDSAVATIAAQVELTTQDGTTHRLFTPAARGSPANPMTDGDLEDKLRTIAASWQPGYDAAPLIDAIWALDRSEDPGLVQADRC